MKTIIYVDVLLAVNLLITYILLLLTCAVLRMYVKKMRLVIGAVLGAVYSLTVLAPNMGFIASVLLKFFMCTSIVCVTFRLKNIGMICKCCICFFTVNITFSGLLLLFSTIINPSFVHIRNANIYVNLDFPLLFFMTCIGYIILKVVINLFHAAPSNEIYRVRIYIDGLFAETTAAVDSGNTLFDPMSGRPVSILCQSVLMPLLPRNVKAFVAGDFDTVKTFENGWETRISVIGAEFAVGGSVLTTVKVDMVEIIKENQKTEYKNCVLALTEKTFDGLQCQMLLHPSLIGLQTERGGLL